MTNKEYHDHPAMSKSKLFWIADSPEKFQYKMTHKEPHSQALVFGAAFHKYVLEVDGFFDEFMLAPSVDRRTKVGRDLFAKLQEERGDRSIVSVEEMETISGMASSLMENKYAKTLIMSGEHEVSYFWTDELTGIECKCRPDILINTNGVKVVADLKSCESAKTEDFMRDAIKYGYHLQSYMYLEGVRQNVGSDFQFVFIAIEKKPPFAVNVLKADDIFVKYGEDTFRELIGIYKECNETNNWWGYNGFSGIINNLGVPAYIRKEYEK